MIRALAQPSPCLVWQAGPGVYYRLSEDDKKLIATTSWIEFRDFLVVIDANFPWGAKALLLDVKKTYFETHPLRLRHALPWRSPQTASQPTDERPRADSLFVCVRTPWPAVSSLGP